MKIEELNLDVRTYNAVKRFGINTTEELIERLPELCQNAKKAGTAATEQLHKLGLLPFHLGEWVEPERCGDELLPEEFREGEFVIMGFPTESRDWRKVVLIIKIDGTEMYFIDDKRDLMHHTIGDSKVWHIKLESEEAGMSEEMKPAVIVSEDYTRAVTLTRSIIANAQAAQQSLYEVCKGLKEMRDGKLYKELGYQNFEDYTENEVGIKRRQAHNYILIAENMSAENVQSIAQIGSTKLTMLAMLDEPTREAVTETVDVESVTVRELRNEINRITSENADLGQKLDAAQETIANKDRQFRAAMDSKNRELECAIESKKTADDRYTKTNAKLVVAESKIHDLEGTVKDLENRPVEVAVSVEEAKEIERLKTELNAAEQEMARAKKEVYAEAQRLADEVRHSMQGVHESEMQALRDGYERQLAEESKRPDRSALDRAKFYALKNVFDNIIDELESFLDELHDEPRIRYINELDNYWTDNLLYLKREGEGAGA